MGSVSGEIKAGCLEASSLRLYLSLFFFSASRCRNIHYMHEEFSLAARIDPASPIPQHVLITLTVFFFKVCNEENIVPSFLPDSGLYDVKVKSSMAGVSVHFLLCSHVAPFTSCLSTWVSVIQWLNTYRYSHYKKYSFWLKKKAHSNTSSLCGWLNKWICLRRIDPQWSTLARLWFVRKLNISCVVLSQLEKQSLNQSFCRWREELDS